MKIEQRRKDGQNNSFKEESQEGNLEAERETWKRSKKTKKKKRKELEALDKDLSRV